LKPSEFFFRTMNDGVKEKFKRWHDGEKYFETSEKKIKTMNDGGNKI